MIRALLHSGPANTLYPAAASLSCQAPTRGLRGKARQQIKTHYLTASRNDGEQAAELHQFRTDRQQETGPSQNLPDRNRQGHEVGYARSRNCTLLSQARQWRSPRSLVQHTAYLLSQASVEFRHKSPYRCGCAVRSGSLPTQPAPHSIQYG